MKFFNVRAGTKTQAIQLIATDICVNQKSHITFKDLKSYKSRYFYFKKYFVTINYKVLNIKLRFKTPFTRLKSLKKKREKTFSIDPG